MTRPTSAEQRIAGLILRQGAFTDADARLSKGRFNRVWNRAGFTCEIRNGVAVYLPTPLSIAWAHDVRARNRRTKDTPEQQMRRKIRRAARAGLIEPVGKATP